MSLPEVGRTPQTITPQKKSTSTVSNGTKQPIDIDFKFKNKTTEEKFKSMGLSFDSNGEAIAKMLDGEDGDGNIDAKTWNEFAKTTGGKKITKSINLKNAMASIKAYIQRAIRNGDTKDNVLQTYADAAVASTSPSEVELPEEEIETSEEVKQAVTVVVTPKPEPRVYDPIVPDYSDKTTEIKDANGNVTRTETRDWTGKLQNTVEMEYDADGKVTKTIEKSYDESGKKVAKYVSKDANGNVRRAYEYEYGYGDTPKSATRLGANNQKKETILFIGDRVTNRIFYNSDGQISEEFEVNRRGDIMSIKKHNYEYGTGKPEGVDVMNIYKYQDNYFRDPFNVLNKNRDRWDESGLQNKMPKYRWG